MRFEPVFLPDGKGLEKRVSQTFLRHFNACPRSGYFAALTKGEGQTAAMVRGSALHAVCERGTQAMIQHGEPKLPPEVAKVIVDEVLAEYPVPIEEHDQIREMAFRWAEEWVIDPAAVIACETLFALDVGGWEVRAKVDFAELRDGTALYVGDYKSGRGAPPYDEISRKRSDGTISTRNIQLILYALALVYGHPVRVEPCECHGPGGVIHYEGKTPPERCPLCDGREFIETIEPFALAPRAQEVICEFVYPGIEDSAGLMLRRTMGLTRFELEAYRESLAAIVARLERAEQTGDWPAVVSDQACSQCPLPAQCPIPSEVRDHRGEINTLQELQEACEVYYVNGLHRSSLRREIKATAAALGGPTARVRFGKDRVWEIGPVQERVSLADREGLVRAVQSAVDFGTPFRIDDFLKVSKSTPFGERSLTEAELAAEKGEANGGQ